MQKLIEGARKFMDTVFEREKELFDAIAASQWPKVLFVTCSDSRIDPHLITQTKPNDLFVIRNAGNFVPVAQDTGEAATIEYAVSALGVTDIIVCGHSNCGAVTALIDQPAALDEMPAVKTWLENAAEVREIVDRHPEWEGQERIDHGIEINALYQLKQLAEHPAVAARLQGSNPVRLHAWIYDIGGGKVRAFDSERGEFVEFETDTPIANDTLRTLPRLA